MAWKSYDYLSAIGLFGDDYDTLRKLVFKVSGQPYLGFKEKRIEIDGKIIQLHVLAPEDITNKSMVLSLLPIFMGIGMLLTYDITRHESFEYVSSVYRRLISEVVVECDIEVMLVGFNCHLEYQRMVPTETAARVIQIKQMS